MSDSVKDYYEEHKEKLHKLVKYSDNVLSAMAASIIKVAEDGEEEDVNRT